MTNVMELYDGVLRAELTETEWAGVATAAALDLDAHSPLRPVTALLPVPTGQPVPSADPRAAEAARLALAPSYVMAEFTTTQGQLGLTGRVGTDLRYAASAMRAIGPPPDAASQASLIPGVRLGLGQASAFAGEIAVAIPGEAPQRVTPEPGSQWEMPSDFALLWSRAAVNGDDAQLREIAQTCGWGEPPALLVDVAAQLDARATVAISLAHSAEVLLLQWLRCPTGWVQISVEGDRLLHLPCTREHIVEQIVTVTAGAFSRELEAVGEVSGRG